ncbi:hypothetical protein C1646_774059 [Rhizophagus diaphanus]|nr:hypothetical protein C1646_774059 [Rhizophagus diaphanus] [Rhizophagus sp. MUCL 43196]
MTSQILKKVTILMMFQHQNIPESLLSDETVEQCENRLAQDKENKCVKKATAFAEQRELRLQKRCECYHMKRKERLALSNIEEQLNRQNESTQDDSDESQLSETYAYHDNVINFSQNVKEFATQLPRNPSSLDVLIVRHKSANSLIYKNFTVRRTKVTRALCWLKQNNRYYTDIVIDEEVLQSLPEDELIDDQLPQIDDVEQRFNNDDDIYEDMIGNNDISITWPSIDGTPINEFQTLSYIACAFPTLYLTENKDLCSNHVREVKPSEYFLHLLKYKDRRFARHPHWRYFTLNSQMRWRVLQKSKVYVKQVLDDKQYTVEEIKEIIEKDNHMADRIIRFGKALCETKQFEWQHCGSPHVHHGIGKRKDAPSIDWKKIKEDKDMMNNVVHYLDSLVTTKNPDQDALVPAQHPCKKRSEELRDNLFGYSKEITNDMYLRDNNGQLELITARNNEYVNPHDRLQLQGLLLHTIAKRNILAQETCHLLLGISLYHSSHQFVTLNFNKLTHQWLCKTEDNNEESFLADSEVGQTIQSSLQKYWWKLCKKENIVRIWPRLSPQIDGPQWKEFCCIKVLLHIIENDPVDILSPLVDNLENESNDEDSDYEYEKFDDDEEQQPDWMILSEMRPDAILKDSSELDLRKIDRNYDWVGNIKQRYTNINLADSPNFIQNAHNLYVEQNNNVTDHVVDPHTLNEKQKIIFE